MQEERQAKLTLKPLTALPEVRLRTFCMDGPTWTSAACDHLRNAVVPAGTYPLPTGSDSVSWAVYQAFGEAQHDIR